MNLVSEDKFKEDLMLKLNRVVEGWIDGDTENNASKTADIIHCQFKIAIEIKDDTLSQPPKRCGNSLYASYDAKKLNRQFYDDIRNANRKFRNYPGYKTILLFRTQLPSAILVREAIMGIHTFERIMVHKAKIAPPENENFILVSPNLTYVGRRGKHNRTEIGAFVVFNEEGYSYFANEFAELERRVDLNKLIEIFGFGFKDITKLQKYYG